MISIGLKTHGHDCGAAIIRERDGALDIVAINEGRLDRVTHSYGWPVLSLAYCLDALGVTLDQVDKVCIDCHLEDWPEPNSQWGLESARACIAHRGFHSTLSYLMEQALNIDRGKIEYVSHIDCHAASAWYLSGFNDAAVLVLEGGQGIYRGQGADLGVIDRCGYSGPCINNGRHLPEVTGSPFNTSVLYEQVTLKLGFDVFGCGKTMALYGFADRFPKRDLIQLPQSRFQDFIIDYSEIAAALEELPKFDPAVHPNGLIDEPWVNLVRQTQEAFFADVDYLAQLASRKAGSPRLCLAGGVFLSCITNRRLLDSGAFEDIFIQPAASDEGVCLGAALLGYYKAGGKKLLGRMQSAYLGSRHRDPPIEDFVRHWQLDARPATVQEIATLLADGRVVGRFAGSSEFGPRALGNRSILADPRRPEMARHINVNVKHREVFRPFAPSCLAETANRYFDLPMESPFMLVAAMPRPEWRDKLPAVLHIDGSSRVQTVRRDQNPDYYALIEAFGQITDVSVVLNTSFNDAGESIVETREDALHTFLTTGMDDLYLDGWLVRKPDNAKALAINLASERATQMNETKTKLLNELCSRDILLSLVEKINTKE